jgi:hypothetical protein
MKKFNKNLSISFIVLISIFFFACNKEDKILPILTMNGKDTVNIYLNTVYKDAGATATDDKDGDITKSIFVKNEVNVDKVGKYKVMYTVSDKAGNVAPTKTRIVIVNNYSSKYTGYYSAIDYIYYPVLDTTYYNTNIFIDSTLNNKLFFSVFSDTLTKKTNVYAIITYSNTGNNIEVPFQKIMISSDSTEYTIQGYGSINDTLIKINYFKDFDNIIYSCKADFNKQ